MAVCPKCLYEYEAHVRVCPECQTALVPGAEVDAELAGRKLVSVYHASDELSVRRVHGALQTEGIRAMVHPFQTQVLDDLPLVPSGAWGEVLVFGKEKERAVEIIDVIETGMIVEEEQAEGDERSEDA